jgi:hypothetical protein
MSWSDALVRRLRGFSFAELRGATFRTSIALNDAKTLCDLDGSTCGGDCSGTAGGAGISSTG